MLRELHLRDAAQSNLVCIIVNYLSRLSAGSLSPAVTAAAIHLSRPQTPFQVSINERLHLNPNEPLLTSRPHLNIEQD